MSNNKKLSSILSSLIGLIFFFLVIYVGNTIYSSYFTQSNLPFWSRYPYHQCENLMENSEYLRCIENYIEGTTEDISVILKKQSEAIDDAIKNNRAIYGKQNRNENK